MATSRRRSRRRSGVVGFLADHRGVTVGLVLVVVAVVVAVGGKLLADRAADDVTAARAGEVEALLDGTTPQDFLALNAERGTPGDVARAVRDQSDLAGVDATAERAFIRFQPHGWWAGFTERCVVAVVTESSVDVAVRKTACVRVEVPDR